MRLQEILHLSLVVATEAAVSLWGTNGPVGIWTSKKSDSVSLLIPCGTKHGSVIGRLLESVERQTMLPLETILVVAGPEGEDGDAAMQAIANFSFPGLRGVRRVGDYTAGNNRRYLLETANGNLSTFFDCDDYLHPQRTEFFTHFFRRFPDLDAALHLRANIRPERTNSKGERLIKQHQLSNWKLKHYPMRYSYEDIRKSPAFYDFNGLTWNVSDSRTEPNHAVFNISEAKQYKGTNRFWSFPNKVPVFKKKRGLKIANGWHVVRTAAGLLVPYPDMYPYEDSLYNWRLVKAGLNFTIVDCMLGVRINEYMHYR